LPRIPDCLGDYLQNFISRTQHIIVPKAHYSESEVVEDAIPADIGRTFRVLAAVDFNDNLYSQIREIDHISSDRYLPLELQAVEAVRA
jgi:hypothetical protein